MRIYHLKKTVFSFLHRGELSNKIDISYCKLLLNVKAIAEKS